MEDKLEIVELGIDSIIEPADAIRKYVDEEELTELTKSIKEEGLLEPIKVRKRGDKYEIVDGHMRFLAHKLLKKPTIKAYILDVDDTRAEAIKIHTYAYKVTQDPVGEAEFYHKKLTEWDISIPELAEKFKIPEQRIRQRLELLTYPQEIKDAIGKKQISLAVAKHLANVENEKLRKRLLQIAKEEGCSERKIRAWIKQYEYVLPHQEPPSVQEIKKKVEEIDQYYLTPCEVCGEKIRIGDLDTISGHRECIQTIREAILREKEMSQEMPPQTEEETKEEYPKEEEPPKEEEKQEEGGLSEELRF